MTDRVKLVDSLRDIQPTLLLFLRKLHRITITLDGKTADVEKCSLSNGITRLKRTGDEVQSLSSDYRLFSFSTKAYQGEEKRQGINESVIVLAFPITDSGEPSERDQDVHAFLPLRSYGFRVSSCV